MWIEFMVLIGGMWALQAVMTYFQIRNLRGTLRQVSGLGHVGLGTAKGRFGPGTIVVLVGDQEGRITDARVMTGFTVFSRFRPLPALAGQLRTASVEALSSRPGLPSSKSFVKALTMAAGNLGEKYAPREEEAAGTA